MIDNNKNNDELWRLETQNDKPLSAKSKNNYVNSKPIKPPRKIISKIVKTTKAKAIMPKPPKPPAIAVIKKPVKKLEKQIDKKLARKFAQKFDRQTLRKIHNGIKKIQAKLDLHGLTQQEAKIKIKTFLQTAQKQNKRLLLIVTGKGRDNQGILKQQVPKWFATTEFENLISQYATADKKHGGEGALYVQPKKIKT